MSNQPSELIKDTPIFKSLVPTQAPFESMSSSTPPLPQGVGYGVVLGLGFFFALMMNVITWIQSKFSRYSPNSAAEFTAASRSLKTGLVVAGILSSCTYLHYSVTKPVLIGFVGTWSLTLLQSATQSYNMGISGGYWYAVGGTLQIAIFSVIASKVKMNANRATTFPEVCAYFHASPIRTNRE